MARQKIAVAVSTERNKVREWASHFLEREILLAAGREAEREGSSIGWKRGEEECTNAERCTYTLAIEHNTISSAASLSPASASFEIQSRRASYIAIIALPWGPDRMVLRGASASVT